MDRSTEILAGCLLLGATLVMAFGLISVAGLVTFVMGWAFVIGEKRTKRKKK